MRYGWRTLVRNPAFAATTILTPAVGLSLTTGVFTVFDAYVLRSFAVRDPGSLHQIVWHAQDAGGGLRWQNFEMLRARRDLFDAALAQTTRDVSYEGRPLAAELVSDSYFSVLEPVIAPGRGLRSGDEGAAAVVISHHTWASLFGRDPAVIGRTIELSGHRFTVVGSSASDSPGCTPCRATCGCCFATMRRWPRRTCSTPTRVDSRSASGSHPAWPATRRSRRN